jgi:murein DD-endopeptidase MepM/ murein hydrolase activator NlpD
MSRLFIFLLGVLVGAAGVHLLVNDGSRSTSRPPAESRAAPDAVAPSESAPPRIELPPTPDAPSPSGVDPDPIALELPAVVRDDTPTITTADPAPPIPAIPPMTRDLLMPVAGIQASQLRDTYTQARGTGRLHDAIDIMAPRGTPVLAVDDGKVAKLFLSKQGGLTVYQFDREEKLAYYYAHLDSYAPNLVEGKLLKRGDPIGLVGSTGNANPEGPHLHFAVFVLGPEKSWWKGTPINPYPLLGGRPRP